MGQLQNLLGRLSNVFSKDPQSNLGSLMNAIGTELDLVDPAQTLLSEQFAMSKAQGASLDMHGVDWGVPRRSEESDDDYRARIQAVLPIYTTGPTVEAISNIVANFTGTKPILLEFGPLSFYMGVTPMGEFVFNQESPFSFQVQVQNPNNRDYVRQDLEDAVNRAKPVRATATFIHQGGR